MKLGPFFALLSMHQGQGHPMPPPMIPPPGMEGQLSLGAGKLSLAGPGTLLAMHQVGQTNPNPNPNPNRP